LLFCLNSKRDGNSLEDRDTQNVAERDGAIDKEGDGTRGPVEPVVTHPGCSIIFHALQQLLTKVGQASLKNFATRQRTFRSSPPLTSWNLRPAIGLPFA